jgi:uncharacterized protein (DUF1697 family)
MPRYVALLRGINVTGHNKITMAELKQLFGTLGHTDVATYLQSGNVIFTTRSQKRAVIGPNIEGQIKKDLGLDVRVLIRTPAELEKMIAGNPFARAKDAPKSLYVTFLAAPADKARASALDGFAAPPDEFRVDGLHVYLRCPKGYGRSKLNNTFWERKLALDATTRNWNTVQACLELASGS